VVIECIGTGSGQRKNKKDRLEHYEESRAGPNSHPRGNRGWGANGHHAVNDKEELNPLKGGRETLSLRRGWGENDQVGCHQKS